MEVTVHEVPGVHLLHRVTIRDGEMRRFLDEVRVIAHTPDWIVYQRSGELGYFLREGLRKAAEGALDLPPHDLPEEVLLDRLANLVRDVQRSPLSWSVARTVRSARPALLAFLVPIGIGVGLYFIIQRAADLTTPVAHIVAGLIFVGYASFCALLFFALIRGAARNEWDGPLLALVRMPSGRDLSLSRLQSLLWTVALLFAWLYLFVLTPTEFPVLPTEALVLMGLSGATYLGAQAFESESPRETPQREVSDGQSAGKAPNPSAS